MFSRIRAWSPVSSSSRLLTRSAISFPARTRRGAPCAPLDLAIPRMDRHAVDDIGAGGEPLLDQCPPDAARLARTAPAPSRQIYYRKVRRLLLEAQALLELAPRPSCAARRRSRAPPT